MWRNWNPCALLVGMQNAIAKVEKKTQTNTVVIPQKIKNRITL